MTVAVCCALAVFLVGVLGLAAAVGCYLFLMVELFRALKR
jgi:hypothetical protein